MINPLTRPKIAITNDLKILRCRLLVKLIELCGAEPVIIPIMLKKDQSAKEHLAKVELLLSACHGLLLPGNKYDVPPNAYNQDYIHPETAKRLPKDPLDYRFETEKFMLNYAINRNWPILAICGGMQVANVTLGGSLIQHLPDDEAIRMFHVEHKDPSLKNLPKKKQEEWAKFFATYIETGKPSNIFPATHKIEIIPDSKLADIYRIANPEVDLSSIYELSIHHQGCFPEHLAAKLKATAFAPDGLVEAAELQDYDNICILTQFHVECNVSGIAKYIVQYLIEHAALFSKSA